MEEASINEINDRLTYALEKATCTKRAVGAVLMLSYPLFYRLIEGYNGPPESFEEYCRDCPRKDSPSGMDMDICPAIHAEVRTVLNAAKMREDTENGTLFVTCGLPCKDCMKELIVVGIKKIVSPYPLDMGERDDGFSDGETYNFNLAYQMMIAADIEYVYDPMLVKGPTAHVQI